MNAQNAIRDRWLKVTGKTNAVIASGVVLIAILIFSVPFVISLYGAQLGVIGLAANFMFPGLVSDDSFKRAVMHPERDDAYSAYSILAERRSDVAHQIALQQLDSSDDYLWLNAAEYLGAIGDPKSIPYLIKALRHTAWRGDDKTKASLVRLTGTDCFDFNGWQHWWLASHPNSRFDWDSHLGFRPRISEKTSMNGVITDGVPGLP